MVGIFGEISFAEHDGFFEIVLGDTLTGLGVSRVHGVMLGADLVVEALISGAAFRVGHVGSAAVEIENDAEFAEGAADIAVLPGIHGGAVNLSFLLAQLVVFLLEAIYLGGQLQ